CPPGGGNDAGFGVAVRSQRSAAADGALIDVSVLLQALERATRPATASAVTVFVSQRISSPTPRIANRSPVGPRTRWRSADTISRMTLDEAQRLASRLRDELGRAIIDSRPWSRTSSPRS